MKSLRRLYIEELVLIEHKVVLYDAGINSNRDEVFVFLLIPALKDAGQEDALLLFFYHLHQKLGIAYLLYRLVARTLKRLLGEKNQVILTHLLKHRECRVSFCIFNPVDVVCLAKFEVDVIDICFFLLYNSLKMEFSVVAIKVAYQLS